MDPQKGVEEAEAQSQGVAGEAEVHHLVVEVEVEVVV